MTNLQGFHVVMCVLSLLVVSPALGQRNLLTGPRPIEWVKANLVAPEAFKPYPPASDRAAWEGLSEEVRAGLVKRGEALLEMKWESLPASQFLEFAREGNRSRYERAQFERRGALRDLTLAECVENKGRFMDQIVNGIWLTCEETYWGLPAHVGVQQAGKGLPDAAEPTIDLFAAETASQLAWTTYLLGSKLDAVSPLVRPRIALEMDRRIFTPFLDRDDFWWMGLSSRRDLNNWTPWIISNILPCAMIVEPDADRRAAIVHKSMIVVDNFLNPYPADGSCDEGPNYWGRAGGSLFDCLEMLSAATAGQIDIYDNPLVRNMAMYIHRAHIGGDWYVNFGDASARAGPEGALVYRFGRRVKDPDTIAFGAWLLRRAPAESSRRGPSLERALPALFDVKDLPPDPKPPLVRDVWLPDLQMIIAREQAGSDKGLFLAAIGGHNAQSHNHNDVGSFVVALDGVPMLIDVGVETYRAQTFGPNRYDIWTMQSGYHNLPTINDVMQRDGRQFAAREVSYRADDAAAEISMDIAAAYPREALCKSWKRSFRFVRSRQIEITDTYALESVKQPLVLNLMTGCEVDLSTPGRLVLTNSKQGTLVVAFDASALKPQVELIEVTDARLKPVWGEKVHRVQLIAEKPASNGTFTITLTRGE